LETTSFIPAAAFAWTVVDLDLTGQAIVEITFVDVQFFAADLRNPISRVSEAMQKRQEKQSKEVRLIAWKAQQRLHKRFRSLSVRKKNVVVVTAIARELTGFVWAIACQIKTPDKPAAPEIIRTAHRHVYVLDPKKTYKR
jgi:hypothetical protein